MNISRNTSQKRCSFIFSTSSAASCAPLDPKPLAPNLGLAETKNGWKTLDFFMNLRDFYENSMEFLCVFLIFIVFLCHFYGFFIFIVFLCDFYGCFFPTCQVRVVRFYVSCLLLLPPPASCLLLVLLLVVLLVQLQPAIHSVLCRTSTTTIHAQCSLPDLNHDHPRQCALPDLNHDHPRPVFPAGPQPRPSTPSVPCRTSTTTIHAQCSLPDLNREYPRQVFPAGPRVGR